MRGSARSDTQNRNHGKRFIGSDTAKSLSRAPDPRHAVDFIIEEVRKHPGELTIAEIGPCSNLALAVLKAPDIVPLIAGDLYGRLVFQARQCDPDRRVQLVVRS